MQDDPPCGIHEGMLKMNTIMLFVEYLLSPIRIVRIRIIQFRRSVISFVVWLGVKRNN